MKKIREFHLPYCILGYHRLLNFGQLPNFGMAPKKRKVESDPAEKQTKKSKQGNASEPI